MIKFRFFHETRVRKIKTGLIIFIVGFSVFTSRAQPECSLTCNQQINVPLDENCQRLISIEDVLEKPLGCTRHKVALSYPYGTHIFKEAKADRSHIGYTFIYSVIDTIENNSCWGYLLVEDKFPPQPACKNIQIGCFQVAQFNEVLGVIQDNCSQEGKALISKLNWVEYGCDSSILGKVYRTIRTFDQWGNSVECMDTLRIRKDSLKNIKCPDHLVLNCRVQCKKPQGSGYDLIEFSSDPAHPNYPSPEMLLRLQSRDTFNTSLRTCISRDSLVVPGIRDLVTVLVSKNTPYPPHSGLSGVAPKDTCVLVDSCVLMWQITGGPRGGLCKVSLGYKDQILPLCGTSFKIRREWKIADWCANRDTTCIQYIKIEDREIPIVTGGKKQYDANVKQHDCLATIPVGALSIDDCDSVAQMYYLEYTDGDKGKKIVLKGILPSSFTLPAFGGVNGKRCYDILISIVDPCLNKKEEVISICVSDVTPPTPLCDEKSQVTVDPASCWARIYAIDLDNGSRDNCCNLLHFAIAGMQEVETIRKESIARIEKDCGTKEYWDKKSFYDAYIENWINCYVFKDYIDLNQCGEKTVILRIYESCGIPLYDPHVFPCSLHDWFCYNTSHLFRAEFNFNWFDKHETWFKNVTPKSCDWKSKVFCGDSLRIWLNYLKDKDYDRKEGFAGSIDFSGFHHFNFLFYLSNNCFDLDFTPDFGIKAIAMTTYAPGNTCSKNLYNDCMISVGVADKTPPVCDEPKDITVYCDGVTGDYKSSYAKHQACTEGKVNSNWPKAIECQIENDGLLADAFDPTGKAFGYYGGPLNIGHDEHGISSACDDPYNTWKPIYCKAWLCLDSLDQGKKVDYKYYFSTPVLKDGGKPTTAAGSNKFYIWDNCAMDPGIKTVDTQYLDRCGSGWLKRTWTSMDKCGNKMVCDQKITAVHRSDFEVIFPSDVVIHCKAVSDLEPGEDKVTGNIMIMDDECELVGVHYEDTRYDIVEDACSKIVRKWTLIDWCKYDPSQVQHSPDVIVNDTLVADIHQRPCVIRHLKDDGDGYLVYTQIIKIVDDVAPVLQCRDTVFCTYANECKEKFAINFSATDNCTPASLITYRWELDMGANGSIDQKSGGNIKNFNEELAAGNHTLTVIAKDHCGNEDTCRIKMTVKDCKKPTPYCYNGISTVIMPTTGEITIWARDFNAGSFDNCTKKDKLKFYFGDKDCANPGPVSLSFGCKEMGTQILCIFVVDEAGNTDYCTTYVLIQDNNVPKICEDANLASFGGYIKTENAEPVQHVQLELRSATSVPSYIQTGSDGKYQFNALDVSKSYLLVPDRNTDWMNGVSTQDLVVIQQHVMGIKTMTSMYKLLAADVNNSKDIDVVDLVELRKLILGIYEKLPANKSWRFAEKLSTNPHYPFIIKEVLEMKGISPPTQNYDFVGIKIGDVNQSATPHELMGIESRNSGEDLVLIMDEINLQTGKTYDIPLKLAKPAILIGYQFTLGLDKRNLEYLGYKKGILPMDASNFGYSHLDLGLVTTSWNNGQAMPLQKDAALFYISIRAKKDGLLSQLININSKVTRSEAYPSELNSKAIRLEYKGRSSQENKLVLYQNSPNPFNKYTVIGFEMPKTAEVSIKITDIAGKTLKIINGEFGKGYNQIQLLKAEFPGSGVRYYQLVCGNQSAIKKMVLLE